MKAYEFYVLLGKYKRKSLTRAEFDRFCRAIETIRNFRHSFYESTGEYYPVARRRKSAVSRKVALPATSNRVSGATGGAPRSLGKNATVSRANEFVELEWSGSSSHSEYTQSRARPTKDDSVTEILDQHKNFRRVRSRKRKKFRWYRLGRDIVRNHPFKIFLTIVFVIAVILVASIRPGFKSPTLNPTTKTRFEDLSSEANQTQDSIGSLTSGRHLSEADKLLAVDPTTFELSIETDTPEVPIVGLEQAIKEGLEARFPDPETALPELDLPKVEYNDSEPKPE